MADAIGQKVVVRVSTDTDALLREYADAHEITVGEAADRLISTGHSRLAALAKYNKKPAKKKVKKNGSDKRAQA